MIDFGFAQSELAWGDAVINEADIRKILSGIKTVGGSRVRFNVGWNLIESNRGQYNWTTLDRAVNLSASYGLKPLLNMLPAGRIAGGGDGTAADFGDFCAAAAKRYGSQGSNLVAEYEIWNEPNWSTFFTPTTPAAYMEFLKPAHDGIKGAQSSATVITGGTTPVGTYSGPAGVVWWVHVDSVNSLDWYTGLYNLGVGNYCDAIGYHWYSSNDQYQVELPSTSQIDYVRLQGVRDLMVSKGDGTKKIWITEMGFGYPTVTPLTKCRDYLKTQVDMITARSWIGPFFLYSYRNAGTDTSNANNQYGIVDFTHQPKSPYFDYVSALNPSGTTVDTTPPSTPTGLAYSDVTTTTAKLYWNPSTDNVGVTNYRVYTSAGVKVGEPTNTNLVLTGLLPGAAQGFYVTAVDQAGNESSASATVTITTDPPVGVQSFNKYNFIGSPSVPTFFTQLGLGFSVTSDIARHGTPSVDGNYFTLAPYTVDQASPDHSSRITIGEVAKPYGGTSALAAVRMSTDGTTFIAASSDWGGADSVQIIMSVSGVVTVRNAANSVPLGIGDDLWCTAVGNVYTVTRVTAAGDSKVLVTWTDTGGIFPGKTNRRAGIGWHHRYVGGNNYPAPGITGVWRGYDVSPVQGSDADAWLFAITDDEDEVIGTGLWELAF